MSKQDHQPLRIIISRLNDDNSSSEEISQILQLLISYAQTPVGALHLSKVGILESLEKNSIIRRIKDDDLYVSCNTIGDRVQSVRNKTHI